MKRSSTTTCSEDKKQKVHPHLPSRVFGFLQRNSSNEYKNKTWGSVVNVIRAAAKKTMKFDESLAFQKIEDGEIFNYFFRVPYDALEVYEYINQDKGGLNYEALCNDPEVKAWWEEKEGKDGKVEEVTWQQRFEDYYIDESTSELVSDKTLLALLQKHHTMPFVEIELDDEEVQPDCGPDRVKEGCTIGEHESLADILDSHVKYVTECPLYSICSAETGQHLYGVQWQAKVMEVDEDAK